MLEKIQHQIVELSKVVERHQKLYYVENNPEINDYEYDQLLVQLKKLEAKYPQFISKKRVSQLVGSDLTEQSKKMKHKIPVLSLKNSYHLQDTLNWAQKIYHAGESEILVQWKIDGATLVLYYQQGRLVNAITRGTGNIGEDITENALYINGVKSKLKNKLDIIIRGEVYMTFKDFATVNEAHDMIYLNPRNLAAGSLKHKNPLEVKERRLQWRAFDCHLNSDHQRDHQLLQIAVDLGLPVTEYRLCKSVHALEKTITDLEKLRKKLPYAVDGLVLKCNSLSIRKKVGSTSHSPRWAIAYKFPPELAQTKLLNIEVHVGRTGRITPRAVLEPVSIAGTTVTHASLHNNEQIERLQIRVGSLVEVSKRGDIIPAIERVIKPSQQPVYTFPSGCPSCRQPLLQRKELVGFYCENTQCKEKIIARLIFFVSRTQMDIRGLGESRIRDFYQCGWIKTIPDIYRLYKYKEKMLKLPRYGEKSTQKLLAAIEQSKRNDFMKVLVALGFQDLGPSVAQLLIEHAGYDSLKKIIRLMHSKNVVSTLESIKGIGGKTIKTLQNHFRDENNKLLFQDLKKLGLSLHRVQAQAEKSVSEYFKNQVWCITGSFSGLYSRKEITKKLESDGARVTNTVTNHTTHLLVGDKPGSKLEKAKKLSLNIITELEFLKMIRDEQKRR